MKRLLGSLAIATGLTTTPATHSVAREPAPVAPQAASVVVPTEKVVALTPHRGPRAKKSRPHVRPGVYDYIKSRAGERAAKRFTPLVIAKAEKYGLPPLLIAKVINRESSFRPHVELHGCYGLMQVAHFHFKPGQNPYDPATNIDAGCRVLAKYYGRFRNWPQALTAYNFGPTATASRGLSTSRYARLVMSGN